MWHTSNCFLVWVYSGILNLWRLGGVWGRFANRPYVVAVHCVWCGQVWRVWLIARAPLSFGHYCAVHLVGQRRDRVSPQERRIQDRVGHETGGRRRAGVSPYRTNASDRGQTRPEPPPKEPQIEEFSTETTDLHPESRRPKVRQHPIE